MELLGFGHLALAMLGWDGNWREELPWKRKSCRREDQRVCGRRRWVPSARRASKAVARRVGPGRGKLNTANSRSRSISTD